MSFTVAPMDLSMSESEGILNTSGVLADDDHTMLNDPEDYDNPCASVSILSFSGIDKRADFSITIIEDKFLE